MCGLIKLISRRRTNHIGATIEEVRLRKSAIAINEIRAINLDVTFTTKRKHIDLKQA